MFYYCLGVFYMKCSSVLTDELTFNKLKFNMMTNINKKVLPKMKNLTILSTILVLFFLGGKAIAQTYTIDTEGTVSACSGTFYDSGGSGGSYTANENYTITFQPSTPGDEIQFNFTFFNLEATYDYLYIYDGPNTSSPQISGSPFSGSTPGIVASTNGYLTFVFDSDTYVHDPG
jgi:hypothetical protein